MRRLMDLLVAPLQVCGHRECFLSHAPGITIMDRKFALASLLLIGQRQCLRGRGSQGVQRKQWFVQASCGRSQSSA
jgi:hypothetical protein